MPQRELGDDEKERQGACFLWMRVLLGSRGAVLKSKDEFLAGEVGALMVDVKKKIVPSNSASRRLSISDTC
jgi:hypothetical protein